METKAGKGAGRFGLAENIPAMTNRATEKMAIEIVNFSHSKWCFFFFFSTVMLIYQWVTDINFK